MEKISVSILICLIMAFFLVGESGATYCSTCPNVTGTIVCNATAGNIGIVDVQGQLIVLQPISSCCVAGSGLLNTALDLSISLTKIECLAIRAQLLLCVSLPGLLNVDVSVRANICGCLSGRRITCNAPQPSKCPDCKKCCSAGSYCNATYGKCP